VAVGLRAAVPTDHAVVAEVGVQCRASRVCTVHTWDGLTVCTPCRALVTALQSLSDVSGCLCAACPSAIPAHVAFIMDGNRRFAQEHHMVTLTGHALGYDKLKEVRGSASCGPHISTLCLHTITRRAVYDRRGLMRVRWLL